MALYDISDLEAWDDRICEKVVEFSLQCFPQEFELCDHHDMISAMTYSGMPSHYPHWSYGKAYERIKTMYDYGVSGLPYEMVINANPSLAYLMRDNSLLLQIFTIAHVYGHNDFFKNNTTFMRSKPEHTMSRFKAHAVIIRTYRENPSIGIEKMADFLEAARAVSLQCQRNLLIKKRTREEQEKALRERYFPTEPGGHHSLAKRKEVDEEAYYRELQRIPLEPDEDILLFIARNNPHLAEWQRNVLGIVHDEAQYFLPQIETKIMNEGWASYWHKQIVDSLQLPPELHMEFLVRHNQVLRPHPGSINPYHLGFKIWENIRKRYDETPALERAEKLSFPSKSGLEMMFLSRETDRDISFLRRHLTQDLIRELDLFEYAPQKDELIISHVGDEDGWRAVKETLIRQVGTSTIPVIRVHDADFEGKRTLFLMHEHEGRDLELEYAEKTLGYIFTLWGREVVLETKLENQHMHLIFNHEGFSSKKK